MRRLSLLSKRQNGSVEDISIAFINSFTGLFIEEFKKRAAHSELLKYDKNRVSLNSIA